VPAFWPKSRKPWTTSTCLDRQQFLDEKRPSPSVMSMRGKGVETPAREGGTQLRAEALPCTICTVRSRRARSLLRTSHKMVLRPVQRGALMGVLFGMVGTQALPAADDEYLPHRVLTGGRPRR